MLFLFLTNPLTDEILDGKGQIAGDLKLLISLSEFEPRSFCCLGHIFPKFAQGLFTRFSALPFKLLNVCVSSPGAKCSHGANRNGIKNWSIHCTPMLNVVKRQKINSDLKKMYLVKLILNHQKVCNVLLTSSLCPSDK